MTTCLDLTENDVHFKNGVDCHVEDKKSADRRTARSDVQSQRGGASKCTLAPPVRSACVRMALFPKVSRLSMTRSGKIRWLSLQTPAWGRRISSGSMSIQPTLTA